jgi:hypothetical protein
VYNLTVDTHHNFALGAGVIVKNTQANRASLSKPKITQAHVSESFGKIEVADLVLAICQNEDEFALKRGRLAILKNRDNITGATLELFMDFERMIIMDVELAQKMRLLEEFAEMGGVAR